MVDKPDGIVLKRARDLDGREWHRWVRWSLMGLLTLFVFAGLFNAFGQRPASTTVSNAQASLKVYAPARIRSGLLWEARFTIRATQEIKDAQIVLSSGWLEANTINTIEPSPLGEASRNGSLSLDLGHVPKGERYELYIQFQTNPTNLGRRHADVQLQDGDKVVLSVDRTITIFP